jgi:DNA repair protein RecO (recombination protein O)
MPLYRETGVVLRTHKLGEADRIITLLTPGRGKVRAVAKGVRKTKSKFGARLEPTSHVALQLYEGRDLDTITQVESIDLFRAIRTDLPHMRQAMAMLEAVDQLAQEGESNDKLYQMLLGGLRTLEARPDSATILSAFYWKLLAAVGFQPVTDQCVVCGATEDFVAFSFEEGGVTCRNCRQGIAVKPETIAVLNEVLTGGLNAVLDLPETPVTHELESLATQAMEFHLERRLRAVHVIAE